MNDFEASVKNNKRTETETRGRSHARGDRRPTDDRPATDRRPIHSAQQRTQHDAV